MFFLNNGKGPKTGMQFVKGKPWHRLPFKAKSNDSVVPDV
jgi:hypothetical protein